MKILFYRYNSICEPDLMEVFRKFEIEVYEDTLEMTEKHASLEAKLSHLAESYAKAGAEGGIDFVFSLNFFPHVSEFCERFHLLYVCWSVDCPVLELFSPSIRNQCNRIFLFDYVQYQEILPFNPEGVFYLPLAANVERWDRELSTLTQEEREEYSADISFVGSLYHEKSPLTALSYGLSPVLSAPGGSPIALEEEALQSENVPGRKLSSEESGQRPSSEALRGALSLPEYLQGYARGLAEAQLLIYGSNFLRDMMTPQLIEGLKKAYPDFHTLPGAVIGTDAYVAANYYVGMLVSELERVRVLNALAEREKVTVYTRSDTSRLQNVRCRGGITTHVQMPRVFHLSKINLNITMKGIQSGLSLRVWDVLGCGGFLLTNYQTEVPSYFEIGRDLECYESIEDCVEKAGYYLQHEDQRREIAENGYRKVKELHTYEHRVAEMFKMLFGDDSGEEGT